VPNGANMAKIDKKEIMDRQKKGNGKKPIPKKPVKKDPRDKARDKRQKKTKDKVDKFYANMKNKK